MSGTKDPVGKASLNKNGPQQKGRAGGNKDRSSEVRQGPEINSPCPSDRREAGRSTPKAQGFKTCFSEAHSLR